MEATSRGIREKPLEFREVYFWAQSKGIEITSDGYIRGVDFKHVPPLCEEHYDSKFFYHYDLSRPLPGQIKDRITRLIDNGTLVPNIPVQKLEVICEKVSTSSEKQGTNYRPLLVAGAIGCGISIAASCYGLMQLIQ